MMINQFSDNLLEVVCFKLAKSSLLVEKSYAGWNYVNTFAAGLIQAVRTKTAGMHMTLRGNFSGLVSATDPVVKVSKDVAEGESWMKVLKVQGLVVMKVQGLVVLSILFAFHRPSTQRAALLLLSLDELMGCCALGTNE